MRASRAPTPRTIVLDSGELRGRGSYVVVPPSVHETGKVYTWIEVPQGPLPQVPALLAPAGKGAACGEHEVPAAPIVVGEGRHPYMKDFAVRLLRAGITDRRRLLAHLRLEFELSCEPEPPPTSGYSSGLPTGLSRSRGLASASAPSRTSPNRS
jgi:hypothetical protein